jgi:hypothetical protein
MRNFRSNQHLKPLCIGNKFYFLTVFYGPCRIFGTTGAKGVFDDPFARLFAAICRLPKAGRSKAPVLTFRRPHRRKQRAEIHDFAAAAKIPVSTNHRKKLSFS